MAEAYTLWMGISLEEKQGLKCLDIIEGSMIIIHLKNEKTSPKVLVVRGIIERIHSLIFCFEPFECNVTIV